MVVVLAWNASEGLRSFTLVLLLIGIAGDIALAALIGLDVLKGDWFLPLLFAVVPALGVIYLKASDTKPA